MNNPSRLEVFPDEIILDLFSYIPPTELYYVWHNLNYRFRAILRSVRISFDCNEYTDTNLRALNYFSQQIVYLHMCISYKSFDLRQFPNLRSLIIDTKLTNKQLDAIRPNILTHLTRLTFSEWWKNEEPLNDVIFDAYTSHEQNISWIKVYHLPSMPNYFLTYTSNLSSIQTMIFDRVHSCDIHLLLSLQILLRRLKITVGQWMPDDIIPKFSPHDTNYQHKHLIHLDITMNTCNKLDDLYPLLSHIPCLRYLHVACDSLIMNDFKRLALELNTRVPWLTTFNCSFKQTYIEDMKTLRCMSSLFRGMRCKKIEWGGGWHYYCVTTKNV